MPWVSKAELRRLIRQIAKAEAKADKAESALELERHENRISERHFANMLLRKVNSFPLKPEKLAVSQPAEPVAPQPKYDKGELDALVDEAKRLGLSEQDAKAYFMREKNIDIL